MKRYECKKHGSRCQSYVVSLIKELEDTQREPTEEELELIEEVAQGEKK